jgi:hypothetical protein
MYNGNLETSSTVTEKLIFLVPYFASSKKGNELLLKVANKAKKNFLFAATYSLRETPRGYNSLLFDGFVPPVAINYMRRYLLFNGWRGQLCVLNSEGFFIGCESQHNDRYLVDVD